MIGLISDHCDQMMHTLSSVSPGEERVAVTLLDAVVSKYEACLHKGGVVGSIKAWLGCPSLMGFQFQIQIQILYCINNYHRWNYYDSTTIKQD